MQQRLRNALKRRRASYTVNATILLVYSASVLLLAPIVGAQITILSAVPIVAIGWQFGARVAILTGVLFLPLHAGLLAVADPGMFTSWLTEGGGILGTVALIIVGTAVGILSDLRRKLQERGAELEHVATALRKEASSRTRAETEKRRGEQLFETAFGRAAVGMAITSTDGRFLRVNRAMCVFLGYEQQELLGLSFADVTHPDDAAKSLEARDKLSANITSDLKFEKRYVRKDGTVVWSFLSLGRLPDDFDENASFVAQVQDITERKRIENRLAAERDLLHALMDSLPNSVYFKDTESRFTRVNKVAARRLGLDDPEAAVGRSDADFFDAEYAAETRAAEREMMRTRTPITDWEFVSEIDGELVWDSVTKAPICGADGECTGIVGIGRVITDRKKAEAALRESEERFRAAFDRASVGMAILDSDLRYIRVNAALCRFLGYDEDELLTLESSDVTHPDDWETSADLGRRLVAGSVETVQAEKRYVTKDKDVVWGAMNAAAIPGKEGEKVSVIAQIQDITERKKAGNKLRDQSRQLLEAKEAAEYASLAKSEFISQMSHDFRTPLHTISLLAHMLSSGVYGAVKPKQAEKVGQIDEAAPHLGSMIDDILNLSKDSESGRRLAFQELDVADVCEAALRLVEPLAAESYLKLDLDLRTDARTVVADRTGLVEILVNLLSNAINVTGAGGSLGLRVSKSDRYVKFTVWDTGPGIGEEDLSGLFEPFTQLGNGSSGRNGGAGLGLALVKRLALLHNGDVAVESELGVGSRFSVLLPAAEAAADIC